MAGCSAGSEPAPERVPEVETFTEFVSATKVAEERGVPMLVDFYATWCEPCKVFDADLESTASLAQALQGVAFTRLDAEREDSGLELAEKYDVHVFPSFILLDAEGEEIDRWAGYSTAEDFIATLKDAYEDLDTVTRKKDRFESEPTAGLALRLARVSESRGEYGKVVSLLEHAAALDPQTAAEHDIRILQAMGKSFGEPYDAEALRAAAEKTLARPGLKPVDAMQVAWTMHKVAKSSDLPQLRVPFLMEALELVEPMNIDDEATRMYYDELSIVRALLIDRDEERAVALKRDSMEEGWRDEANGANEFAWWCFENRVNLEEAYDVAVRGAELADDDAARAMILDTVAEICNARGDCEGAIEWIDKAIAADPESQYYKEQRTRFEELLASTVVM
jgi:thioredoxin-like negative regulator of GroEL